MSKVGYLLLLLSLVSLPLFAQNGSKNIELKDITDGIFRQNTQIGEMHSLPDGEHYTAMNPERTRIVKYSYRTGDEVGVLFDTGKARECTFENFQGYIISPTGNHILLIRERESIYRHSYKAMVYEYDVRRNYVKPLSDTIDVKLMIPTFSPDGRMCAFVRDNNIWIKKFDYDTEVQVTKDGETNKILNGITDWVYEEEFGVTNLMAWSPDNETLAFVKFDESAVKEYSMQVYGNGTYPGYFNFKYPKAGEQNSKVSLHAYNVTSKDIKQLEIPGEPDSYISRITFTENSDQLAVMTLNRHQNVFNMYYANPKSTVFKLILREENKHYVDSDWLKSIRFTKNGFTYVSEQDGYAHIYVYSSTGIMQRQVTKGEWDVTRFLGIDDAQTIYYESAEEGPLKRAVYKIDSKGNKVKLSKESGTNSATFSSNYSWFVNNYSSANVPTTITVNETRSGKTVRTLVDNAVLKNRLSEYKYTPKEFIKLNTASGQELNAWIVKPADFSENKKYPVMMTQYSGPNSQQVLDRYGFDWEHYLAANGIIVVCVDGRGTGARGEEFRKCTYLRMGELESKDQIEAAQALSKLPYINGKNIAIWGWSFGGYNTLMALSTGNGTFKAGIAVAPPTDWKYYDTIYTERYMRTPNENFEGYAVTSPIQLADKLQGNLLLVHGTADDNVHFAQTMEYAEALVQANKQFEMQIYKDRDHSIYGGNTRYHLYTRMSNFLFQHLK